jgi:hypothetical protein
LLLGDERGADMITVFKYCEREAVVRKGNEVNDRHGETALTVWRRMELPPRGTASGIMSDWFACRTKTQKLNLDRDLISASFFQQDDGSSP